MITFKPFRAIRPRQEHAQDVASRPYDVLDSTEAKNEAAGNPNSFLRVIKPEIDLPDNVSPYSDEVYQQGKKTFLDMVRKRGYDYRIITKFLCVSTDYGWQVTNRFSRMLSF